MVDAATRVFAQKGYDAATMKEIAAEAGYTAPAFYNYFEGKEQLFEALLARTFEETIATLVEEPRAEKTFEARLDALMRRQFALVDRRTDTFRVLMSAQVTSPAPHPTEGVRQPPEGYRRLMELLTGWFARAAGSSRVGVMSAPEAAMVYMAVTQAYHFQWMTVRPSAPFVEQVERVRDVFLRGVLGAARTSRGAAVSPPRRRAAKGIASAKARGRVSTKARGRVSTKARGRVSTKARGRVSTKARGRVSTRTQVGKGSKK
ncbi:MAG: TetR/AcrR family transcriptional regulator [Deltaproteobacteria bacterium]|nr:TetR/AcrR family transcriptional regulator [Deltaproteobacteria bacterium]